MGKHRRIAISILTLVVFTAALFALPATSYALISNQSDTCYNTFTGEGTEQSGATESTTSEPTTQVEPTTEEETTQVETTSTEETTEVETTDAQTTQAEEAEETTEATTVIRNESKVSPNTGNTSAETAMWILFAVAVAAICTLIIAISVRRYPNA